MAAWNPRANELFLNALERCTAEERRAYLDAACAGDGELRRAVDVLLAAHEAAGSFLEQPEAAPAPMDAEPPAAAHGDREKSGRIIAGRYKLLQPIGEGGMGTVWMAEQQEPVRRLVALKLIKADLGSAQV